MFSTTFQICLHIFNKKYYNLTFYSNFSTHAIFFEEIEQMFIHTISIATDDGIIQFGDVVNTYPVYLSRAVTIWGNCLNWLANTIISDYIFVNFL